MLQFVSTALASANEVEYELLLARDLGFLPASSYAKLSAGQTDLQKMLHGLIRTLRQQAMR